MGKAAYITKKMHFCAAHRLHSDQLSDEENKKIFGKCNNTHGHNYKVQVTVVGEVNETTGMVMNFTDLKSAMQTTWIGLGHANMAVKRKDIIVQQMDHKSIDQDIEYFSKHPSTAENIAIYLWDQLSVRISEAKLHEIKIAETNSSTVVYRGK